MKYIANGKEIDALYDSTDEIDAFYDSIKKGALPTTTQVNSYEFEDYFTHILKTEPGGDIIHIPLSSGLSGTCDNGKAAAEKINETLTGRRIYVIDSLLASIGMAMQVDKLIAMRDAGITAADAVKKIEEIRAKQQTWVIVDDLFHLKRGGRISGFKAAIGTLLKIKPIIVVNKIGRLTIESSKKGSRKAVQYLLEKMDELGEKARPDFKDNAIYILRSSPNETYEELKQAIKNKYPRNELKDFVLGPIVGTHIGRSAAVIVYEGAERLDI